MRWYWRLTESVGLTTVAARFPLRRLSVWWNNIVSNNTLRQRCCNRVSTTWRIFRNTLMDAERQETSAFVRSCALCRDYISTLNTRFSSVARETLRNWNVSAMYLFQIKCLESCIPSSDTCNITRFRSLTVIKYSVKLEIKETKRGCLLVSAV